MCDYVIFVREGKPNEFNDKSFIDGKTCQEITEALGLEDEILAIQNEYFREPIELGSYIYNDYPEIAVKKRPAKFERTNPFIAIVPKSELNTITLFINVLPQEGVDCPYFSAQIDLKQMKNKTVEELFKIINDAFIMEHENPVLTFRDKPVDLKSPALDLIDKARHERLQLNVTLPEKVVKACHYRTLILSEIVKTEETYIGGLNRLITFWHPQCVAHGLLTDKEAAEIFKHFPVISACHSSFYDELIKQTTTFSAQVAVVLLNFSELFKTSSYYIGVYNTYLSMINEKQKNPNFMKTMMEVAQKNPYDKAEILTSLLITPVQRMPRYILFIKELIKKTPKCHPDYPLLITASVYIDQVTRQIEAKAEHAEDNQKMFELERRLTKPFPIFAETRRIEDTIDISILRMEKNDKVPGKLYILNDMIVFTQLEKKSSLEKVIWGGLIVEFHYVMNSNKSSIHFWWDQEPGKRIDVEFVNEQKCQDFMKTIDERRKVDDSNAIKAQPMVTGISRQLIKDEAGISCGDSVYFIGGLVDGNASNQMMIYNPATSKATITTIPIPARSRAAICSKGDKIYVHGGQSGEDILSDLWEYNTAADTWTQIPSDGKPRAGHTITVTSKFLIVFGGYRNGKYLNSTSVYSFQRKNWHAAIFDGAPKPRAFHTATLMGKSIVYFGGKNDKETFNDIAIFDPDKIFWRSFRPIFTLNPRAGHGAFAFGNALLIVGGSTKKNFAEVLNFETKTVEPVQVSGIIPRSLLNCGFAISGEYIYAVGGTDVTQKPSFDTAYSIALPQCIMSLPNESGEAPEVLRSNACRKRIVMTTRKPPSEANTRAPSSVKSLDPNALKKIMKADDVNDEAEEAIDTLKEIVTSSQLPIKPSRDELKNLKLSVPDDEPKEKQILPPPSAKMIQQHPRLQKVTTKEKFILPPPSENMLKTVPKEKLQKVQTKEKVILPPPSENMLKSAPRLKTLPPSIPKKEPFESDGTNRNAQKPEGKVTPVKERTEKEILSELKIDPSGLAGFQKNLLSRNVKKLIEARNESDRLKEKVSEAEANSNEPLQMRKVFAKVVSRSDVSIVELNTSMGAEEVSKIVESVCGVRPSSIGKSKNMFTNQAFIAACRNSDIITLYA